MHHCVYILNRNREKQLSINKAINHTGSHFESVRVQETMQHQNSNRKPVENSFIS
jgi:hypothetical protein